MICVLVLAPLYARRARRESLGARRIAAFPKAMIVKERDKSGSLRRLAGEIER